MPRVPTLDEFGVAPTVATPTVRAPEAIDIGGRQATAAGQAAMDMGDTLVDIAIKEQEQANQIRVDDALNKLREREQSLVFDPQEGYRAVTGSGVFERKSGKPLADEYTENYEKTAQELAGALSNDWQKQRFGEQARQMQLSFRQGALSHEAEQAKQYTLSVRRGTVELQARSLALNYADPKRTAEAAASIRANTIEAARIAGMSATEAEADALKVLSKAHATALTAAVTANDIAGANKYLQAHAADMDAADIIAARKLVQEAVDSRLAVAVADKAVRSVAPRMFNSDLDRIAAITRQTESGGRQFDENGDPVTSPAGAVGIAQVMPATAPEAAALAGVPFDEEKYRTDPDYNAKLGRAYMEKQLKDFGGDLAKSWAAYNAGPGATRQAIKKAEEVNAALAKGGSDKKMHWLQYLPKETQAYVEKNVKAYEAGQGAQRPPTLLDVQNAVLTALPEGHTAEQRKLALATAESQFKLLEGERKSQDEFLEAEAMRALVENGGDFNALPASLRSNLPVGKRAAVQEFAKKVRTGANETDPAVFLKLSDPDNLARLSDDQFFALRGKLSESDWQSFATQRGKPPTDKAPDAYPSTSVSRVLDNRLEQIGINPKPKASDADETARVAVVNQTVRRSVLAAQASLGRKMTDAEIETHIDGMFAKRQVLPATMFRWGEKRVPAIGMTPNEIPSALRNEIKAKLREAGIPDPTDADVLNVYLRTTLDED